VAKGVAKTTIKTAFHLTPQINRFAGNPDKWQIITRFKFKKPNSYALPQKSTDFWEPQLCRPFRLNVFINVRLTQFFLWKLIDRENKTDGRKSGQRFFQIWGKTRLVSVEKWPSE
jgi:hypothetical protein